MGAGATVGAGQYPAKFTFATTTASCSDWVAYNTGVAGVSSGRRTSLLTATSTTPPAPHPILRFTGLTLPARARRRRPHNSLDGSKIAFVENPSSGAAMLRILAWHAGQGTAAAAHTPDKEYTNTTAGNGSNTAWNTTNCPATGSCMISIAFQDGDQDTSSAPFYNYSTDTLYVGDSSGKLHEFTGVFNGTPGEVVSATAPIWPIAVSANKLTSPVFDSGSRKYLRRRLRRVFIRLPGHDRGTRIDDQQAHLCVRCRRHRRRTDSRFHGWKGLRFRRG